MMDIIVILCYEYYISIRIIITTCANCQILLLDHQFLRTETMIEFFHVYSFST